jgi:hypothetical protein
MKIWLLNINVSAVEALDWLDEFNCDAHIMYEISNHTPQWLSCSDEDFKKLLTLRPELVLTSFDADVFEAAATAAALNPPLPGLNKYSCLAFAFLPQILIK